MGTLRLLASPEIRQRDSFSVYSNVQVNGLPALAVDREGKLGKFLFEGVVSNAKSTERDRRGTERSD